MLTSIFIAVAFSSSGMRVETYHPSMDSCVEYLLKPWGFLSSKAGWCDEKIGSFTICSKTVMPAFGFWDKPSVSHQWCLTPERIERLKEALRRDTP